MLKMLKNRHLVVVLLSIAIYELILLLAFNVSMFKPIGIAIKEFSLSDVYSRWERKIRGTDSLANEDIIIVNTKNLTKREDIASVIRMVYSVSPRVIGVDITFNEPKDSINDKSLIAVADSVGDSTVFACKLTDFSNGVNAFNNIVKPFFAKDNDATILGYDNLNDNLEGKCIRSFSFSQQVVNYKAIYSLPAAMMNLNGHDLPKANKTYQIDYTTSNFISIAYDSIRAYADLIAGRMILIGSLNDEEDMHLTPLGKMSGVQIHAYTLNTLINHSSPKHVSDFWNWIIAIIIGFSVELSICSLNKFLARRKVKIRIFLSESLILLRLLMLLWLSTIGMVSFLLFWKFNIYIETILPLAIAAFIPDVHRIYNAILHSMNSRK